MKRCWVHIGMHKTSSTSVQQNLKDNRGAAGWELLDVGGLPNMGPALHAMFSDNPEGCFWFTGLGHSVKQIAENGMLWKHELQERIEKFTGETFIISGEALSENLFCRQSIQSFRDFLLPLFDEIFVIGYVRLPYQYKNSRFQEFIKSSRCDFDIGGLRLDYRARFEKYDDIFGRSNVILRKFDPTTFPDGCAVADFCDQTGINLNSETTVPRFNQSLSRNACSILYTYRRFGPGYGTGNNAKLENAYLIRALSLMGGSKLKLTRQIIDSEIEKEYEDIRWMELRLGEKLFEQYLDEEDQVKSEDDLLNIHRSTCEEFISCFEKMYKLCLFPKFNMSHGFVEPTQVAELVQNCRIISIQLISQKIELKKMKKNNPRVKKAQTKLTRVVKFLKRKLRL
jgi:hypothetical protein